MGDSNYGLKYFTHLVTIFHSADILTCYKKNTFINHSIGQKFEKTVTICLVFNLNIDFQEWTRRKKIIL